jgi:hypothetical protein
MPLARFEVLLEWWFWALLPVVLVLMSALDRALSNYCQSYWRRRGQDPPPNRVAYHDAGRLLSYAALTGFVAVVVLVQAEFLVAAVLAGLTLVFCWLGMLQARRNVI